MNADDRRLPKEVLAKTVVGAGFRVSNELGISFLEKVYENALAIELKATGYSLALLINHGTKRFQVKRVSLSSSQSE